MAYLTQQEENQDNSNKSKEVAGKFPKRDELSYAYSSTERAGDVPMFAGTKSVFNNYAMFRFETAGGRFNMLYDAEGQQGITPQISINPTASQIIKWSIEQPSGYSSFGATPYSWSDFLWCEFYGKIPNNYMITVRRFPIPVVDNLKGFEGINTPPMAQAVTFMGEETGNKLSEITKFFAGLKWKTIEADVQNVAGNEKGSDSGLFSFDENSKLGSLSGFFNPNDYSGLAQAQSDYSQKLYSSEGPYANKVYGPVNVVTSTMARDRGMDFKQDIKLTFHYEAKSIGSINPKAAMLDIMANMLSLTYNNAKFWGGAIRYFPQHPRVAFLGDQKKFYSGDIGGYINSLMDATSGLASGIMEKFSKLLSDPIAALKDLAVGGTGMAMGAKAAKDRPQIIAMRSLLTGAPMGEWHMCIGNPMNPIAMVGNLVCDGADFEFNDILGADDFPTKLKVTLSLKHGKPRDKGDIESMFNYGNGRLYYGIQGQDKNFFDPDKPSTSSSKNSNIDTSGTKGNVGQGDSTKDKAANNNNGMSTEQDYDKVLGSIKNNATMWGNRFKATELPATLKFWD